MGRPLTAKEFADLNEQILAIRGEKDRIRLVKAALTDTTITAEQAIGLLDTVRFGEAKVDMTVACHPHVPVGFDKVLAALPYQEDRDAVNAKVKK